MDGTTHYWNEASEKLYGYSAEEAVGKNLVELLIPPEMHDDVKGAMAYMAKTGQPIPASELSLMRKDGSRVAVFSSHAVIQRSQGEEELFCIDIDLTENKRTEEALRLANKKLNLLSGVTRHNITNQLTVLQSFLAILNKDPVNAGNEYFRKVVDAARSISAMIRFTKEYESVGVNAPVWQDCRTLVDTAAREVLPGKVGVKNDIPSGAGVFADPLIVKAFYNLIDNAVRHGGEITTIRFSLQESGDGPVIICEDDGGGVPAGDKEGIFELGFGKNTGMGLFFAREILSITGITIRENGDPGKGARFEMAVPTGKYRFNPGK
jgi:PAS domain S-box-containing protein